VGVERLGLAVDTSYVRPLWLLGDATAMYPTS
jgi:hypothetical protein